MKKTVKIITMGTLLATGGLYAGGAVAPIVVPVTQTDPNPFYVGVGLLWAGTSADCITNGYDTVRLKESEWGGIIRAGWEYNQYVGIEGRALKASIDSNWGEVTHYGIFLKPQYPIAEQINIYGLLGYGHTKIDTVNCPVPSYDYNGFSYGIGLEYDFSNDDDTRDGGEFDRPYDGNMDQETGWGLWVDYQNLMNDQGPANFKSNIVTFGVTYDF